MQYKLKHSGLFWFLLILTGLILCETLLVTLSTGYLPTGISFLLWDRFDFFLNFFRDEPLETLSLIFINKPLFKIVALQENPVTAIWELHYYSITLISHLLVAIVFSSIITRSKSIKSGWQNIPVSGSVLLILSSLFLYLSSCCTSGSNWVFHTWLLSIVFDPVTATDSVIEIYNIINSGFIWLQTMLTLLGIFLIFRKVY